MSLRKKLIAGNWKMNKTASDGAALVADIVAEIGKQNDVDVVVCPPFTGLESAANKLDGSTVKLGAQNMHPEASGAYTGEISAGMLRALFVSHVILGHSERRSYFAESDAFINQKVIAALKAQLKPILCVGETLAEREAGSTLKVVQTQLEAGLEGVSKDLATSVVIAYEPVWAIGTGLTPTAADVAEVHALIRDELRRIVGKAEHSAVRVLYGGSVKPSNAAELMSVDNVNGALVGGASLLPADFLAIAGAYLG
jgi:triosephosphate isomerase (TIM)